MRYLSRILLAKAEVTYDTDSTPTTTDAMLTSGLTITPYGGEKISRNLDKISLGASPVLAVNPHVALSCGIEIAGSGAAGTAPPFGDLLQACGCLETVNAGVDVTYTLTTADDSVTAYFYATEVVGSNLQLHKATGVRGNWGYNLSRGQIPLFTFDNLLGTYYTPSSVASITPDTSDFQDPLPVTKVNSPTVTIDSATLCVESVTFNCNNQISRMNGPNCAETLNGGPQQPGGTIVVKAPEISEKNLWTLLEGGTLMAFVFTHGTTAGNIVTINHDKMQITDITETNLNGVLGYQLAFAATDNGGADEPVELIFT